MTPRKPWPGPPGPAVAGEAPASFAPLQLSPAPQRAPTPTHTHQQRPGAARRAARGPCKLQPRGCGCCRGSRRPRAPASARARGPSRLPDLGAFRPQQAVRRPSRARHGELTRRGPSDPGGLDAGKEETPSGTAQKAELIAPRQSWDSPFQRAPRPLKIRHIFSFPWNNPETVPFVIPGLGSKNSLVTACLLKVAQPTIRALLGL